MNNKKYIINENKISMDSNTSWISTPEGLITPDDDIISNEDNRAFPFYVTNKYGVICGYAGDTHAKATSEDLDSLCMLKAKRIIVNNEDSIDKEELQITDSDTRYDVATKLSNKIKEDVICKGRCYDLTNDYGCIVFNFWSSSNYFDKENAIKEIINDQELNNSSEVIVARPGAKDTEEIHTKSSEDKWKATKDWRNIVGKKDSDRLVTKDDITGEFKSEMPLAQYHSLTSMDEETNIDDMNHETILSQDDIKEMIKSNVLKLKPYIGHLDYITIAFKDGKYYIQLPIFDEFGDEKRKITSFLCDVPYSGLKYEISQKEFNEAEEEVNECIDELIDKLKNS